MTTKELFGYFYVCRPILRYEYRPYGFPTKWATLNLPPLEKEHLNTPPFGKGGARGDFKKNASLGQSIEVFELFMIDKISP